MSDLQTKAGHFRHKREVCKYWMRNACQKEDKCEFLHVWDADRMPRCTKDSCDDSTCPLKHEKKRFVCANYAQGFCSFGRQCPHEHVQLQGPAPAIASMFTFENPSLVYATTMQEERNFQKRTCSYWQKTGWCPYFEMCAFAHFVLPETSNNKCPPTADTINVVRMETNQANLNQVN